MKTFYNLLNLALFRRVKSQLSSKRIKISSLFILLLFLSNYSFAQGKLTFDNFPLKNNSYKTEIPSWQGDGNITWHLTAGAKGKSIHGITPLIGTNGKKGKPKHGILSSSLIKGGLGSLQFNYCKAFSKSGSFIISINDVVIETLKVTNSNSEPILYSKEIDISGDFTISIESTDRLLLDDLEWTGFGDVVSNKPELVLSLSESLVSENSSAVILKAVLSEPLDSQAVIKFNTRGSASIDSDYKLSTEQIIIPANELSSSLLVDIIKDDIAETEENISFSISNLPENIYCSNTSVNLRITDDDNISTSSVVQFLTSSVSKKENSPSFAVDLVLDKLTDTPLNITISADDCTDISSFSKTVHFDANTKSASMHITINNDNVKEETESFTFTISSVDNNVSIGKNNVFTLYVLDKNDIASSILSNYVFLKPEVNQKGKILVDLTPKNYVAGVSTSHHMSTVRVPDAYYHSAIGLSGEELKSEVASIISTDVKSFSYKNVWNMCADADQNPKNHSQVWQVYVEKGISKSAHVSGGSGWNREHTWAKSHGDFGTRQGPGTDGHHLRAADAHENSIRGSRDFSNSLPGYTPPKSSRGDVARMIMYMALRWDMTVDDNSKSSEKSARHGKLSDLLKWHEEDPVDPYEIRRNNVICYKYQHNRNPFVDHPELAQYIFGQAKSDVWKGTSVSTPSEFKILSSLKDFGTINLGDKSEVQQFSFSSSFFGKDVNVKAPKDIFISSDGVDFSSDLLLSISKDQTISVYVRYIPSTRSALIVNEKIRIYSDDDSVSVNVNAREGDPDLVSRDIYSFDFDIVNTNWTQYSVSSNNNWHYSKSKDAIQGYKGMGMFINNFSGDTDSDDWLISPLLDFSAASNIRISYWLNSKYEGSNLDIMYSDDYKGTGNPSAYVWHELKTESSLPTIWTESNMEFPYVSKQVYIAFRHTSGSGAGNSSVLCIDDFKVTAFTTPLEGTLTSSENKLVFAYTQADSFSDYQSFVINYEKLKGDVSVSSDGEYQFSVNNTDWSGSLSFKPSEQSSVKVNVRYAPKTKVLNPSNSKILIHAQGAENKYVLLHTQANEDVHDAKLLDKSETLDIVSWNIEWFGAPSKSKHAQDFNTQLEKVSTKIIELDADIYAIQELVTDDLNGNFLIPLIDKLNALAGSNIYKGILAPRYSHDYSKPTRSFPAQRLCYIINTNTVNDISNFSMFSDLYAGSSTSTIENYTGVASKFWASGRTPFMLNADITINGKTENIKFVNIHAKCCSNSYDRKLADANFLLKELLSKYADDNIVLLGDYNDFLTGSMSGGHKSPYEAFFADGDNFKAVFTSSTNIDHISISNELYDENDVLLNNTIETNVKISDHKPIMLRLKLNTKKSNIKLSGNIEKFNYVDITKPDFKAQEQSIVISSESLKADVDVLIDKPFQLSINGIDWYNQAKIDKTEVLNQEIKIRFNPNTEYSDNINAYMYIRTKDYATIKTKLFAYGKPDIIAPIFSNSYPSISYVGAYNITVNLKLNEPSVVYYLVLASDIDAPLVNQIITANGGIYGSVNAGTSITNLDIKNLDPNTSYSIYLIAKDKNLQKNNVQKTYITLNATTKKHILLPWEYISTVSPSEHRESLNIPKGYYYDAINTKGEVLKTELKKIINTGFVSYPYEQLGRGDVDASNRRYVKTSDEAFDVYDIMDEADQDPNNPSKVYMIYKELSYDKDAKHLGRTGSKEKWNREHVYPQSLGGFKNARATWGKGDYANGEIIVDAGDNLLLAQSDAHHLRCSDKTENSIRSNRSFTSYDPPKSSKGDVARIIFYLNLRYNLDINKVGSVELFKEWSEIDPVDPYELHHNNVVYKYQKNRNPFIDHPELIDYIYGSKNTQTWASISKKTQKISFETIDDKKSIDLPFELNAVSDSGLEVSYTVSGPAKLNGNIISLIGAGTVTVTAIQEGNNEYFAAESLSNTFEVANATAILLPENINTLVYPIPTTDFVNISIKGTVNKTIYLINTKGLILSRYKATDILKISMRNYKKGVYFIKIGDAENQTYKIIKQ